MQIGKPAAPVSRISQAYPDRVEVRGRDLTGDLMGRLTFTEYFHLLLTGREPTEDQRFFLDLLLVAIAEHGLMPTNVAARMTLAAEAWGKPLTMNVAMPIAAVMLDLDFPAAAVKAVPILARTAGLLAHLAEEREAPLGFMLAAAAEQAVEYEPPADA
jgi:citrate synthase